MTESEPRLKVLEGKVAIVTGAGRERGIGRSAALELARWGADVVVTDIGRPRPESDWVGYTTVADDMAGLEALAEEIEAFGSRSIALPVDVTSRNEIDMCIGAAVDAFGGIDVLFNNAGTPIGIGPFLDLPERPWELSWDVNVMGMVRMCAAVLPSMMKRGGGSIINASSVAGIRGTRGSSAYTTTKFAVVGLTKSLALEFGADNIRANAVCPGDIITQMSDLAIEVGRSHADIAPDPSDDESSPIALKRRGEPADVARVVAWLASDLSGYVTGEEIRVDGGWEIGL